MSRRVLKSIELQTAEKNEERMGNDKDFDGLEERFCWQLLHSLRYSSRCSPKKQPEYRYILVSSFTDLQFEKVQIALNDYELFCFETILASIESSPARDRRTWCSFSNVRMFACSIPDA